MTTRSKKNKKKAADIRGISSGLNDSNPTKSHNHPIKGSYREDASPAQIRTNESNIDENFNDETESKNYGDENFVVENTKRKSKKRFRRSYNCGPCKKHKIKCDMQIPCGSCRKYNRVEKCLKAPANPPSHEQLLIIEKRKRKYKQKQTENGKGKNCKTHNPENTGRPLPANYSSNSLSISSGSWSSTMSAQQQNLSGSSFAYTTSSSDTIFDRPMAYGVTSRQYGSQGSNYQGQNSNIQCSNVNTFNTQAHAPQLPDTGISNITGPRVQASNIQAPNIQAPYAYPPPMIAPNMQPSGPTAPYVPYNSSSNNLSYQEFYNYWPAYPPQYQYLTQNNTDIHHMVNSNKPEVPQQQVLELGSGPPHISAPQVITRPIDNMQGPPRIPQQQQQQQQQLYSYSDANQPQQSFILRDANQPQQFIQAQAPTQISAPVDYYPFPLYGIYPVRESGEFSGNSEINTNRKMSNSSQWADQMNMAVNDQNISFHGMSNSVYESERKTKNPDKHLP